MMTTPEPHDEGEATSRARDLREEGLTLIPLGRPGENPPKWLIKNKDGDTVAAAEAWPKTPRLKWAQFQQEAPTDELFESWAERWPDCNWAILTGRLVVVDADSPEAVEWCESGAISRSPRKVTTSQGAHYYYLENPSVPARNTVNPQGKIDIRGHGGYVVAPGSIHSSGVIYTENLLKGWGDTSVEFLPMLTAADFQAIQQWNGAGIEPGGKPSFGNLSHLNLPAPKADGRPVSEGGRNVAATSLAGQLVQAGHDLQTVKQQLDQWNNTNNPPLSQGELNTVAASVALTHTRNTGEPVPLTPGVNVPAAQAQAMPPLDALSAARWTGLEVPPRRWVWQDWIPAGEVTGLYAPGGTGKTLMVQQLATCMAAGKDFLGCKVKPGKVIGLFCEDDDAELHRRQHRLNYGLRVAMESLTDFIPISRVGHDNLFMTFKQGVGTHRPFFYQVDALLTEHKPALLIVDTAADTFAGNENDKGEVRQYVKGCLTNLATRHGCAVLLCAHPSKAGISTGDGSSGNVAWDASMRSRLYLTEDSAGRRILKRMKANYAPREDEIAAYWDMGAFVLAAGLDVEGQVDRMVKDDFLQWLDKLETQGQVLSASSHSRDSYAPKAIVAMTQAIHAERQHGVEAYKKAMQQLLADGTLHVFEDTKHRVKQRVSRRQDGKSE